jgi:hypothetical protein
VKFINYRGRMAMVHRAWVVILILHLASEQYMLTKALLKKRNGAGEAIN